MLREEIIPAKLESIDIENGKARLVEITNIYKSDKLIHQIYDYKDVLLADAAIDPAELSQRLVSAKEKKEAELAKSAL